MINGLVINHPIIEHVATWQKLLDNLFFLRKNIFYLSKY